MSQEILLSQIVCHQTVNQNVNFVNQKNIYINKLFNKIYDFVQNDCDQFLKRITARKKVVNLTDVNLTDVNLTDQCFYWENIEKKFTVPLKDVIGVFSEKSNYFNLSDYSKYQFVLIINSHIIKENNPINNKRQFQQDKFFFSDQKIRDHWLETIKNILNIPAKRHLHIIVNPHSGKKQGDKLLRKALAIFSYSNLSFNITRSNSITATQNSIKNLDLSIIDGLVIIGGDGTIHEIINMLINRHDWKKYNYIPLGIIPAGTSNGLCKSILAMTGKNYSLTEAILLIIRGKYQPLDVARIQQYHDQNTQSDDNKYRVSYSFLSLAWGLISDVDIQSDYLRFLGVLKTDIYAIFKVLTLKVYQGKIFLLNPVYKSFLKFDNFSDNLPDNLPDNLTNLPGNNTEFNQLLFHEEKTNLYNLSGENWQKIIAEDFILLWAMNPQWAAYNLKPTPFAKLADGKIDILIVKKGVTKWQILKAFLMCATGEHISLDYVEYYQAEGLVWQPLTTPGNLAIDGEKYDYLPIKLTMVQNLINIFS